MKKEKINNNLKQSLNYILHYSFIVVIGLLIFIWGYVSGLNCTERTEENTIMQKINNGISGINGNDSKIIDLKNDSIQVFLTKDSELLLFNKSNNNIYLYPKNVLDDIFTSKTVLIYNDIKK